MVVVLLLYEALKMPTDALKVGIMLNFAPCLRPKKIINPVNQ